ncbi:uncharacterized protein LOC122568572 isoform X1 [Bombus pyrosoma]|uniref:uncharacterized protein LOC122568572 isoform X1 n=1 Tax=Bombus pyrosoma TaxID=396416 RepID=UPI001CB9B618|nr:uncharacterized protein LOC122568572 isoform X1 [Bombus pyrosoma]
MFGHVFLRLFGRFYPRKLLGHDALNEYLRRADRSWYSEATIGRNAPINSNVRGLRGIDVAGKGTNDDHDADDQDGDDDHDARDNAVSMVVRRKKGPRPCRFFSARVTSVVVNNPFEMACSIVLPALRQLVCAQKTNIEWYVVTWTRNYDQTGFYERLDIAALRVLSVWNKNDG